MPVLSRVALVVKWDELNCEAQRVSEIQLLKADERAAFIFF